MKKCIDDFNVFGKKVILRVDFNVPMNSNKVITNDRKITESLPTINYLIEHEAKIILISHLGRPKGKVNNEFSLSPIAEQLRKYVKTNVFMSEGIICDDTRKKLRNLRNGEILVLENIRFAPEEEANDEDFAKKLAYLGEIYCNDAFGTAHRAHASVAGITKFLPSCCGFLMLKELEVFSSLMLNPERPYIAILGGSKVSDKIGLISKIIERVDKLIIGGAMAYTFLTAIDYNVGKSIVEQNKLEFARLILEKAKNLGVEVLLPFDHVVANEFSILADYTVVDQTNFPDDWIGMDIGPKSAKLFAKEIALAKTVYWNGPMGVYEFKRFSKGTETIIKAMARNPYKMIVGGGDSSAAVVSLGLENRFFHVSTGGGASLELIEGNELPGIVNLQDKK